MTRVRALELRLVALPLVRPFRTSFGEEREKECILVRLETDGAEGWGECVAGPRPDFSGEFNEGAWLAIRDHLAPALLAAGDVGPADLAGVLAGTRGNRMAKAAVEMAFLDAHLREEGRSLASFLGATRDRVACGVSVGITENVEELVEQVAGYVAEGYVRVKLKIEPGRDVERVRAVRESFPAVPLSVDANAAYTLADAPVFRALDELGLSMIEQPLSHEDLVDHAELQSQLATPICLDESIRSPADVRAALALGSCRVVNIKQGRVGGLLAARRVHDLCREREVPVWCGGMLETGVGRAANLALASLPGFTLPGDTSASGRYFAADLTEAFVLEPGGTMRVPEGPGLGVVPRPDRLRACTRRAEAVGPEKE
ncbi:MAG TPA: o-succinylbenzoate synthase [Actinomycetota bacterium]|nr:o-succinylbenzoate synthase [Actinomycetota bacterium]